MEERKIKQDDDDYDEEEDDYEDNLSQENLRELYIAALDLAIHRVRTVHIFHTFCLTMQTFELTYPIQSYLIFSHVDIDNIAIVL